MGKKRYNTVTDDTDEYMSYKDVGYTIISDNKKMHEASNINRVAILAWLKRRFQKTEQDLPDCMTRAVGQALGLVPIEGEVGLSVKMIKPGGGEYQAEVFYRSQFTQAAKVERTLYPTGRPRREPMSEEAPRSWQQGDLFEDDEDGNND